MEQILKLCKACGKEKPLNKFYKSSNYRDGYMSRCKNCKLHGIKLREPKQKKSNYTQEWSDYFRLVTPSKSDYHQMYEFLDRIGYDSNQDIHLQFCEKWNLKPKNRNTKDKNFFSKEDCL